MKSVINNIKISLVAVVALVLTTSCLDKYPGGAIQTEKSMKTFDDALRYFAIYWTKPPQAQPVKKVKYRPDLLEDYLNASQEERQAIIKRYGEPLL